MQLYKQSIVVALVSLLASNGVNAEGYMRPTKAVTKPTVQAPVTGSGYSSAPATEMESAAGPAEANDNSAVGEAISEEAETKVASAAEKSSESDSGAAEINDNSAAGAGSSEEAESGEEEADDTSTAVDANEAAGSGEDKAKGSTEELAENSGSVSNDDADSRRAAAKKMFMGAASKYIYKGVKESSNDSAEPASGGGASTDGDETLSYKRPAKPETSKPSYDATKPETRAAEAEEGSTEEISYKRPQGKGKVSDKQPQAQSKEKESVDDGKAKKGEKTYYETVKGWFTS